MAWLTRRLPVVTRWAEAPIKPLISLAALAQLCFGDQAAQIGFHLRQRLHQLRGFVAAGQAVLGNIEVQVAARDCAGDLHRGAQRTHYAHAQQGGNDGAMATISTPSSRLLRVW